MGMAWVFVILQNLRQISLEVVESGGGPNNALSGLAWILGVQSDRRGPDATSRRCTPEGSDLVQA